MKTVTLPFDEYQDILNKARPYVNAEEEISKLTSIIEALENRARMDVDTRNLDSLHRDYDQRRILDLEKQVEFLKSRKWYHLLLIRNESNTSQS